MYKAIFWDNDGVLVDTERFYYQASKETLAREGIELTEKLFCEASLSQSGGIFSYAVKEGLDKRKIDGLRKERNNLYDRLLSSEDFLIPEVGEVLSSLQGRFKMGVVTSCCRRHFETIHSRTDLLDYFEFSLVREDYKKSKPDPEPYLLAAERSKLSPKDCLVIEDSPRGLKAGIAAGMTVWVIPNKYAGGADFSSAAKVLNSVAEIKELL